MELCTAWWRGFYTEATTFNLEAALANKTSTDYKLLIRDIDAIAVQLLRLQSAGISVLWRPLHEAEGGWVGPRQLLPIYLLIISYTVLVGTRSEGRACKGALSHHVQSLDLRSPSQQPHLDLELCLPRLVARQRCCGYCKL